VTYPEIWGDPAKALLRSQTLLNANGRVAWQFPWSSPLGGDFFALFADWTPGEYEGIDVPVLSIQADFAGFFAENLGAKGADAPAHDAAREWAAFDAGLKRRGRVQLLAVLPNATTVEFAATHHWLHLQRPERVVRTMRDFFEDVGVR
jgi:pimeloyl-ACP methyl ester carboxylesterase